MNLPDAHTHPAPAASGTGLRFVCGTSPADWEQVALLAERDGNVTPFFGIHPWFLDPAAWRRDMRLLEEFLTRFPKAGVGETGLDKCRRGIPGMKMQKDALRRHLDMAARMNRPVALHCCRAWGSLAEMLREYPRLKAILHGWTGALNPASDLPSEDWLLSIGPREMERADIFTSVPLHRLALESDEHPEVLPDLYRIAGASAPDGGMPTGRNRHGQPVKNLPSITVFTKRGGRTVPLAYSMAARRLFSLAAPRRRLSCGHGPFSGSNQFFVGNQAARRTRHGSLPQGRNRPGTSGPWP